jgi:hypothetical protein
VTTFASCVLSELTVLGSIALWIVFQHLIVTNLYQALSCGENRKLLLKYVGLRSTVPEKLVLNLLRTCFLPFMEAEDLLFLSL